MSILGKPASLIGAQLLRRDDGFSFQYSLPDDPMFWIRIEQPVTPVLVVTDINFGSFDAYEMADLFAEAMLQSEVVDPIKIRFASIGASDAPETIVYIEKLENMIEAFLSGRALFLIGNRLATDNGKTDLIMEFKSARSRSS